MRRKGLGTTLFMFLMFSSLLIAYPALAQTIRIGVEMPLTGYGALYAEDGKRAVQLGVEEVNNTGGINGKRVEAIFEDDAGVGKTAVAATQKLITVDKVPVIIGGMFSSAALTAAPIAREKKVVFISTVSSHPELTSPGGYIYRVQTTDRLNARSTTRFVTKVLKFKRGCGLMASSDYGMSLAKYQEKYFGEEGGAWLLTEYFPTGSNDFRSQLTKIKEKNPEIIFVAATVKEGAQMLRQMVEFRMKLPIICSSTMADPKLVELVGEAADNVYFYRAARAVGEEGKKREDAFKERLKAKFPGKELTASVRYYYDALNVAFSAIKLGGETGAEIDQGMKKIKDHPGLTGNITFNEIGDRIFISEIVKIDKGKFVETGFTYTE